MTENNPVKLNIEYAGCTDIGVVRTENQDSYGKFPADDLNLDSDRGQLFIVADGVGGHAGGKEASSMAVEVIESIFLGSGSSDKAELLKNAIEEANLRIYKKSADSINLLRMATTCSALLLKGDKGTIGHVGDSRIYKVEDNHIELLTTDHTQVQELLKKGIITGKEAENYPSKSVLARAVGIEEKVKVDIIENIKLKAGQYFILCSDGLGQVPADELLKIVQGNSPEESCEKLIALALERGGKDNITVLIIKMVGEKVIHTGNPVRNKNNHNQLYIILIVLILVLISFLFKSCL